MRSDVGFEGKRISRLIVFKCSGLEFTVLRFVVHSAAATNVLSFMEAFLCHEI